MSRYPAYRYHLSDTRTDLLFIKQNVNQKYRKKLHIATKTKNQIFLFVKNLIYGENISYNEHQLVFSIRYSVFSI